MTGRIPDLGCRELARQACGNLRKTMSEGVSSLGQRTANGLGWIGRNWVNFEINQHPLIGSLPHLAMVGAITAAVSPPGLVSGAVVVLVSHAGLVPLKFALCGLGMAQEPHEFIRLINQFMENFNAMLEEMESEEIPSALKATGENVLWKIRSAEPPLLSEDDLDGPLPHVYQTIINLMILEILQNSAISNIEAANLLKNKREFSEVLSDVESLRKLLSDSNAEDVLHECVVKTDQATPPPSKIAKEITKLSLSCVHLYKGFPSPEAPGVGAIINT